MKETVKTKKGGIDCEQSMRLVAAGEKGPPDETSERVSEVATSLFSNAVSNAMVIF
jgi:hypothetical protein